MNSSSISVRLKKLILKDPGAEKIILSAFLKNLLKYSRCWSSGVKIAAGLLEQLALILGYWSASLLGLVNTLSFRMSHRHLSPHVE